MKVLTVCEHNEKGDVYAFYRQLGQQETIVIFDTGRESTTLVLDVTDVVSRSFRDVWLSQQFQI